MNFGHVLVLIIACLALFAETKVSRTNYDFIVVGSGTAGSIVASQLSKLRGKTVLLIEAGGHDSEVPIWDARNGSVFVQRSPEFSFMEWEYDTVPQPGLANREIFIPRAKIAGGCNTHNQMAHLWGNREDWDLLANHLGDSRWSWNRLGLWRHFTERKMGVYTLPENVPFFDQMVQAATAAGFPFNSAGYNSGDQYGISSMEQLVFPPDQGDEYLVRETTYDTFVRPLVGARPRNLEVMLNHLVTKLIISPDGSRVTGVEVFSIRRNKTFTIDANAEVIVSAGTFKTPQLLMLSGIGPAQHLTDMGIPVVLDLPGVGQNLQDHPLIFLRYLRPDPPEPPITNTQPPTFFVFGPETSGRPSCEFLASLRATIVGLLRPEGRGNVTLASLDPLENAFIDPQFMLARQDLDKAIMCTRYALNMYKNAVDLGVPVFPLFLPFTATDADIENFIVNFSASLSHPTGTCKMGIPSDPLAVVDTNLRVMGIDGLRVIDASVFPDIPSANTNSPTILVAFKASFDMLLEYY